MNAKRKGTRNEHRSMAVLEAAGYRCTRSGCIAGRVGRGGDQQPGHRVGSSEEQGLAGHCRDGDATGIRSAAGR